MGSLLRLLTLQVVSPVLRPLIRLLVGFIAVPVFRLFVHRIVKVERLSAELTKDLEQWVRGSLILLVATANIEYDLIGQFLEGLEGSDGSPKLAQRLDWFSLGLRLLLAVGVIEAMPDQALFSIIHPGPAKLLFPRGRRWRAAREQCWPFLRGILCRHLDRSSSVFAILSVIFGGATDRTVGWVCYLLAITQFLIIGLVSSRDKALDVLSEFDQQVHRRREELAGEMAPAPRKGEISPPLRSADRDRLD